MKCSRSPEGNTPQTLHPFVPVTPNPYQLPTSSFWPPLKGKGNISTEIIMCPIIVFPERVIFISCLFPPQQWYSPLGGSLGTWLDMKREGNRPRVGIWLRRRFGHSLLLIGAVKRICECERMCLCEFEPYLKCENTSRINVRLQYVWRELRGNLHPQVLLHTTHEGKNTELTAADDYLSVLACSSV